MKQEQMIGFIVLKATEKTQNMIPIVWEADLGINLTETMF